MIKILIALLIIAWLPAGASAKTLVVEGSLASRISLQQRISFAVEGEVSTLSFTFALPANFSNRGVHQQIDALQVAFAPKPDSVREKTDAFGNHFQVVTWRNLHGDAAVTLNCQPQLRSELLAMESSAPFPLVGTAEEERRFLQSTPLVQGDDPHLTKVARSLTANARSEYQAVSAILNFVADRVKYSYNPKSYDALYTLESGSGNCQNFAHLSMALLRSIGIPARIVGGISLKEPWKVPLDAGNSLVQSMGQGGHAWMEIYFPDLGWLSYDPQQSKQFTSTRHIKQTHGLDSRDINDSWTAAPYLPKYSEEIEARFLDDKIALTPKGSSGLPRPYLVSNAVKEQVASLPAPAPAPLSLPAPQPAPPAPLPALPLPRPGAAIEFGNIEFPNMVETYRVERGRGERVLDKETSAYVTSKSVYAQAFTVNDPMELETVSLAMHKFGGDGTVYMDIVPDDRGKPSLPTNGLGFRSRMVTLDSIPRKPGYYWVDFPFYRGERPLAKGKYWIILRKSGEAIMNWFYIPGKPYGGGDDTRSTAKGYLWEDILNCDFVFKVKGRPLAKGKGGQA